jgi:hypothetical protein
MAEEVLSKRVMAVHQTPRIDIAVHHSLCNLEPVTTLLSISMDPIEAERKSTRLQVDLVSLAQAAVHQSQEPEQGISAS